jgi:hypothetical protein
MWTWIWIALLYVVGMGFFYWLGGIGAAAKAIERWGRLVGKPHAKPPRTEHVVRR